MSIYQLRPLMEQDLQIVLEWRNSDRVRNNMFNDRIISWDEHRSWFRSVMDSESNKHQIFMMNNKALGILSYSEINQKNGTSFWGFYIGDKNAPKGSGSVMGLLGLDFAFEHLGIEKVFGDVLSFNEKSIRFHERLGFTQIDYFKNHVFRGNGYVDVVRFAISKEEWLEHRKIIAIQSNELF